MTSIVADSGKIEINWGGKSINQKSAERVYQKGGNIGFHSYAKLSKYFDPQKIVKNIDLDLHHFAAKIIGESGHHSFFVEMNQGQMKWWQPIDVEIKALDKKQVKEFSEVNSVKCEAINIDKYLNDSLSEIFQNKYLSPRSPFTTLQNPTQGIGE